MGKSTEDKEREKKNRGQARRKQNPLFNTRIVMKDRMMIYYENT